MEPIRPIIRVPGRRSVVCPGHSHDLAWVKTTYHGLVDCDECFRPVGVGEVFLHCEECTMADDGYDLCAECAAECTAACAPADDEAT